MIQNVLKMVKPGPKMIQTCFNNGSKMVQNGLKMVQKRDKNGTKMGQKWNKNDPNVDHQVDLSAKGSYIITHIGLRAEGGKADSQKHKLDDQQIQLISPIM